MINDENRKNKRLNVFLLIRKMLHKFYFKTLGRQSVHRNVDWPIICSYPLTSQFRHHLCSNSVWNNWRSVDMLVGWTILCYLDDVDDADAATVLERRPVGRHFEQRGLGARSAVASVRSRARFFLAPARLWVHWSPPHVEHDGAWVKTN